MEHTIAKRVATLALSCALSLGCAVAYAEPMAAEEAMKPEVTTVNSGLQADAKAEQEVMTQDQAESQIEVQAQAEPEATVEVQSDTPVLRAQGHVENKGWTDSVKGPNKWSNTIMIGSTGEGLRLEAVRLWLDNADGAIEGRSHVQNIGWKSWEIMSKTESVGTEGQGLRVEAVGFKLPKALSDAGYHLHYCAHVQDYGWLGWAKDGGVVGSAGFGKRIEAVELYLSKPGEEPILNGGAETVCFDYKHLSGQAHVQNIGWQPDSYSFYEDAVELGTTGRGLRVEALTLNRPAESCSGDIIYEAHVQNVGWQGERKNGQLAGTTGQGLRLEAFRVRLTGELDQKYDVWYRGHVQNMGWLGWTKDGDKAGTEGYGLRLESIQVIFTLDGYGPPKGDALKSNYDEPFFAAKR